MIRLACVVLAFTIILVGCTGRPTEKPITPSVSSRIATHSDDPTYAVSAEQHNRSIDVNSELQKLNELQQYPQMIVLARTRRAELDVAILKVRGMELVAQERDRVLTPMHEERNEMMRVVAAASELR